MIEVKTKIGRLSNRTKWFAERPSWADSVGLVEYKQCARPGPRFVFLRQRFQTKVVDLSATEDEIFGQFRKNTQREIRKARRDGVTCHFDGSPEALRRFYNHAAEAHRRPLVRPGRIEAAGAAACISYGLLGDTVLVMHCTLVDRKLGRARVWLGCPRHEPEDGAEFRQLIGRANRLLHFEEMRHFKNRQFTIYDFGGYSADKTDRKQMAINDFKDSFGGRVVVEDNYVSYPLFLAVRGRNWLADLRQRGGDWARRRAPA
jgi:hypothetical protein